MVVRACPAASNRLAGPLLLSHYISITWAGVDAHCRGTFTSLIQQLGVYSVRQSRCIADMDTRERAPTWKQFLKLLVYAGIVLYAAAAITLITIIREHSWHEQLLRFLARAWANFLFHVGSTGPGFVSPILVSVLSIGGTLLCIGYLFGRAAMKEHFWETGAIAALVFITVMLTVYFPQFAWEVIKTAHDDHQSLARRTSELSTYVKSKDQYERDLEWAKGEVRHWQEAYQRAAKGETIPDRIMSHEEEGTLYDALDRLAKDSRNKDYVAIKIGSIGCERESQQLAYQVWQVFQKAHWRVPLNPKFTDKEVTALNASTLKGVTIFTDDPGNHGVFLQISLRDAHLDSQVYPPPSPTLKGTIIWVGQK
jgi:hypothetical protein